MNEFNALVDLRLAWKSGKFSFPETITVAGIGYRIHKSSAFPLEEIIVKGKKPAIIYTANETHKKEAKEAGLEQWLVFIWTSTQRSIILPYDIRPMSPSRYTGGSTKNFQGPNVTESQERIGDVAIMKVFLPSGTAAIKGRVDTGAEMSSLHADDFRTVGDMVRFTNRKLSPNEISVPVADQQAVKTADGGVEYRPVIELNVEINGKSISGALFNLNNRDKMEYPCLIGQNVLEKTNFLIDPNMNDTSSLGEDGWIPNEDYEIDWDLLQEEFEKEPELPTDEETAAILNVMVESNMTLPELVRYIRTDAVSALHSLQP